MRCALVGLCWFWVGLVAPEATADDLTENVNAALQAAKSGDSRTLRTLAFRDEPGLWLIADELSVRGEQEAAQKLAGAARPVDAAKLPAYLAASRKAGDDKAARALLHKTFALMQRQQFAEIARLIDAATIPKGTVVGYRLRFIRAGAALRLGEVFEGAEHLRRVADEAHAAGDIQTTVYACEVGCAAFANVGLYTDAQMLIKRQVKLDTIRKESERVIEALEKLVRVQRSTNEPQELVETYTLLAAAYREQGNDEGLCKSLVAAAIPYLDLGRNAKALEALKEGLRMIDTIFDAGVHSQAYLSAAAVYSELGEDDRALEYARKSLEANIEEEDALGQGRSHITIGSYLAGRDELDEASKHYQEAIRVAGSIPGGGVTAQCLKMLSQLESTRKNHDAAITLAKKAVDAARRIPQTRPKVGTGLTLVIAMAKAGKYEQALGVLNAVSRIPHAHDDPAFSIALRANEASLKLELGDTDTAAKIVRELVDQTTTYHHGLGAELAAATRSNLWFLFETGVGVAKRTNDPELLFFYQEKGRAAVLLESLGGANRVRLAVVPKEVREEFEQSQYGYRNSQVRVQEATRAGLLKVARARRKEVAAARRRMLDSLQAIEAQTAQAKELIRPNTPDLRSAQAGLREDTVYVAYSVIGRDSCALVASRESAHIVSLPVRETVQEKIESARFAVSKADVSKSIAALRKMLVTPLALDKKVKRVIVSPNAVVAQIPFCALMPDRQVVFVPSMAVARELADSKRAAGVKVLALGDPKYKRPWKPLPHTRTEAKAIGDVVLLGADANRAALKDALRKEQSWRAVHFACHGIVDLASPSLSGLALTDGRLTYFDILQMEIPCDLVTLSACETGRGRSIRNEGVFGLTRAFLAAGAAQVLVSLWPVEDEATQVLMKEFYRHWRTGKVAPGEALQRAQAHVRSRKKWAHPAYWAAWQLWGTHR